MGKESRDAAGRRQEEEMEVRRKKGGEKHAVNPFFTFSIISSCS